MNRITHEEYVKERKSEILKLAKRVTENNINVLDACSKIKIFWSEAELPLNDSYYFFTAISSETDIFPRGYAREVASEEYLKKIDKEESDYLMASEEQIKAECQKLIEEYGDSEEA